MILESQKNAVIVEEGDINESIDMSLDLDSAQILMQMLSKNLYADAVGSTIRETCSNALDSHRRANTKDPIVVSFKVNPDNTLTFSVEDFGMGLDDNDVANIISKYGKSTKRDKANELGMMGLGFKSPLAYSSSFYFICRKNGMEWKYMMYEGEDSNKIDLLYAQHTKERNGVKIIIPVAHRDKQEFLNKIREQLAYFENVYFDTGNVNNDFKIFRSEDFQISQLTSTKMLHICLDNIYYPIDFAKLGIAPIELSVGLRFGLNDGIFPTPNRESIRYTIESKAIILDKIKKVADQLVTRYNSESKEYTKLEDVFKFYSSSCRMVKIGEYNVDVVPIKSRSSITIEKPSLTGVSLLNLERLYDQRSKLFNEYEITYIMKYGKLKETRIGQYSTDYGAIMAGTNYFIYSKPFGSRKRDYLREEKCNSYACYYFMKKKTINSLFPKKTDFFDDHNYFTLLKLKHYSKDQWRQVITEYQTIQKGFLDKLLNIDNLEIPQEWIDKKKVVRAKSSRTRDKISGEICGKIASPLERYCNGQSCKFVPDAFIAESFRTHKGLTVYDSYENQDRLDKLYHVVTNNSHLRILSFSPRAMTTVDTIEVHNLMSYTQFMKGDTKPFKRLVTAYLINKLMDKYRFTFGKSEVIKKVSEQFYLKLESLQKYVRTNLRNGDGEIYKTMLEIAQANDLYDTEIYDVYLDVQATLEKLTFIEKLSKMVTYAYAEESVSIYADLFKYYKVKVNLEHYTNSPVESLDLEALLLTN